MLVVVLGCCPDSAAGQAKAAIAGRVLRAGDRAPLAGVMVALIGVRRGKTDADGRFRFDGLRPGTHQVAVSVLGATPLSAVVTVAEGEEKSLEFRVDSVGQMLPELVVEGAPDEVPLQPLGKFERRLAFGAGGKFVTRAEILQRNPIRVTDMLRFVPGVRLICVQFNCAIRLNPDPRDCSPSLYVDEQRVTVDVLGQIVPTDIHGIEIYRGPSETPPELNDELARCGGAIQIWTVRGRGRGRR